MTNKPRTPEDLPSSPGLPSPAQSEFTRLLNEMQNLHDKKAYDYTNDDPYGNYKFAGLIGLMFRDPDDVGFVTRIAEKLYRLSALQNKSPRNESIEDTEKDIAVIVTLWMASRREKRHAHNRYNYRSLQEEASFPEFMG